MTLRINKNSLDDSEGPKNISETFTLTIQTYNRTPLSDLPEDILLLIYQCCGDPRDLIHLGQVGLILIHRYPVPNSDPGPYQSCKLLYALSQTRSIWMGMLQRIRARRPVPFPEDILAGRTPLTSVSLSCVQRAVDKATSLERAFNKDIIRPKCIKKFDLAGGAGIKWLWLLDGDKYVVTLDTDGSICFYDMIADDALWFHLEQAPDCWDFDVDEEGVTIVVNGQTVECVIFIFPSDLVLSGHLQGPCNGHLSHLVQASAVRFHREKSTHPRSGPFELP